MRVHELAKELGVTSKELLGALEQMGVSGKSASSSVPEDLVPRLRASGGKATEAPKRREVLELLGHQPHEARQLAQAFRLHNQEQLEAMLPHMGDEQQLIAIAKQGRQQLETLWAAQREEQRRVRPWREVEPAEPGD